MFYISDHHSEWQILIGAPQEIAMSAAYDNLSLVIFDDADITAQPKLLSKFYSQSPKCQMVALSSKSNCLWQENIKSMFKPIEINVSVSDPFYRLNHYFTVCASFSEKVGIVAAICDNLNSMKKKAILFAVSIISMLIFSLYYKS